MNVGTGRAVGELVAVGQGASVTGQTVSLKATESKSVLESDASATAISPIFFGVDVALANVNVVNNAVASSPDRARGPRSPGPRGSTSSRSSPRRWCHDAHQSAGRRDHPGLCQRTTCRTPDGDLRRHRVTGATVTAGVRSASGPLEQVSQDTSGIAVMTSRLNVQAYEVDREGR